jgi:hypothetical protein
MNKDRVLLFPLGAENEKLAIDWREIIEYVY